MKSNEDIKNTENIADRIIHAFTIPKAQLFLEDNEDVISYENSEQRLINFGLILATFQCVMFIALLALIANFNLKTSLELNDPVDEDKLLVSYILFLSKCKNGQIVTFKQMKNFEVQYLLGSSKFQNQNLNTYHNTHKVLMMRIFVLEGTLCLRIKGKYF